MVVVVTGVSGSGKTSVGDALARRLGWSFEDGDAFHPAENVDKMRRGVPLTDEDRRPWILTLGRTIADWSAARRDVVLACSALRRSHRDALRAGAQDVRFVFLRGDHDLIAHRLRTRVGHFMPASLLESQLGALEEPGPDEALVVDVQPPIPAIVDAIVGGLRLGRGDSPS